MLHVGAGEYATTRSVRTGSLKHNMAGRVLGAMDQLTSCGK